MSEKKARIVVEMKQSTDVEHAKKLMLDIVSLVVVRGLIGDIIAIRFEKD